VLGRGGLCGGGETGFSEGGGFCGDGLGKGCGTKGVSAVAGIWADVGGVGIGLGRGFSGKFGREFSGWFSVIFEARF
jgi:hypothetical protein